MEELLITLADSVILISKEIKELNQMYQDMNLKIEKIKKRFLKLPIITSYIIVTHDIVPFFRSFVKYRAPKKTHIYNFM